MKILDIVKFNNFIALVVDKMPELTYEKKGEYLIGSDDSNLLFSCLYYQDCGKYKAFSGREFDLPMKDGSTIHLNGQYWNDEEGRCAKFLNINLGRITIADIEELKKCFVFRGLQANVDVYEKLVKEFLEANPNYEIFGYYEYEDYIQARRSVNVNINYHPNIEFQKEIRNIFINNKEERK